MKKSKLKFLAIIAICVAMISTTAISYVFWQAGVDHASGENNLGITIGRAGRVTTELSFDDSQTTGTLVPYTLDLTRLLAGQIQAVVWTIDINWDGTGVNAAEANNEKGDLTVEFLGIKLASHAELNDVSTSDRNRLNRLFEVQLVGTPNIDLTIGAETDIGEITANDNDPTTIQIRVRMRLPEDREDYGFIANANVVFVFNFSVEAENF